MSKWIEILVRFLICVAITAILYGVAVMVPLLVLGCLLGTCLSWALIMGWPFFEWLGEEAGELYVPSDDHFRVRPDFSLAEACVQQGRYDEAIALFRQYSERFPNEVTPHVRIAELLVERYHDPDPAIAELRATLAKAQSDETFSLVANRLADWLVEFHQDRDGAVELMEQIQQRSPDTRHARAAADRIVRLQAGGAGE